MSTASLFAPPVDCAAGILAGLDAARVARDAAERAVLVGALGWADAHPTQSIDEVMVLQDRAPAWGARGTEVAVLVGGVGTPWVAEFCVADFAATLHLSTTAGKYLLADALDLRHRLPKTFAAVMVEKVQVWRGRRIASITRELSLEAAWWVDRQVAHVAGTVGVAALERLIAEAQARFDPEAVEELARQGYDRRKITIDHRGTEFDPTSVIFGNLDTADARDLDAALSAHAHAMAAAGATESHEVLRAIALGVLARGDTTLDYTGAHLDDDEEPDTGARVGSRRVVLHLHLSEAALRGPGSVAGVV